MQFTGRALRGASSGIGAALLRTALILEGSRCIRKSAEKIGEQGSRNYDDENGEEKFKDCAGHLEWAASVGSIPGMLPRLISVYFFRLDAGTETFV